MSSELDLLKQLRDITGAGILDCKKYLTKSKNNLDEAVKLMRSEAGVKAEKKSNRIAAEGVVHYFSNKSKSLLIEINSETDFVAKGDDFLNYVQKTCEIIVNQPCLNLLELTESNQHEIKTELEELS